MQIVFITDCKILHHDNLRSNDFRKELMDSTETFKKNVWYRKVWDTSTKFGAEIPSVPLISDRKSVTLRITGWQCSAAELPVRVDAVVTLISKSTKKILRTRFPSSPQLPQVFQLSK